MVIRGGFKWREIWCRPGWDKVEDVTRSFNPMIFIEYKLYIKSIWRTNPVFWQTLSRQSGEIGNQRSMSVYKQGQTLKTGCNSPCHRRRDVSEPTPTLCQKSIFNYVEQIAKHGPCGDIYARKGSTASSNTVGVCWHAGSDLVDYVPTANLSDNYERFMEAPSSRSYARSKRR